MKIAFCTCVTADYLYFAKATFESLQNTYEGNIDCHALVVENDFDQTFAQEFKVITLDHLGLDYENGLAELKEESLSSRFRWMLKPILIKHLLEEYDAVFWVDPDLYFFNDISHIARKLECHEVVLSPHWRSSDPHVNKDAFFKYFYHGLYNGGFIGIHQKAINLLDDWVNMMLWKMEDSKKNGIFVDQGYLSLFPLLNEKTYLIKDKGCNVSSWNKEECKRVEVDGEILINGIDSIKFIHFVPAAVAGIISRKDKLLRPYLKQYVSHLLAINPNMESLKSISTRKIYRKTA